MRDSDLNKSIVGYEAHTKMLNTLRDLMELCNASLSPMG